MLESRKRKKENTKEKPMRAYKKEEEKKRTENYDKPTRTETLEERKRPESQYKNSPPKINRQLTKNLKKRHLNIDKGKAEVREVDLSAFVCSCHLLGDITELVCSQEHVLGVLVPLSQ